MVVLNQGVSIINTGKSQKGNFDKVEKMATPIPGVRWYAH
jgi:hypothetical protein